LEAVLMIATVSDRLRSTFNVLIIMMERLEHVKALPDYGQQKQWDRIAAEHIRRLSDAQKNKRAIYPDIHSHF
jgi:hypothetical protein